VAITFVDEFRLDDFVMTLQVQGCSCRRNSVSVSGREVAPAYYVGDVLGSENCELRLVCVQIVWFARCSSASTTEVCSSACDLRSTECKLQLHSNLYCKMKYIIVLIKEKGFPMKLSSIKR
jgi:hypothetical protein